MGKHNSSECNVTYSLAVDIGGTFTDIVLRHSSGVLTVDKVLTTHHDLLEGFFVGVSHVMRVASIGPRDIDGVVVHATTIVTNALIENQFGWNARIDAADNSGVGRLIAGCLLDLGHQIAIDGLA